MQCIRLCTQCTRTNMSNDHITAGAGRATDTATSAKTRKAAEYTCKLNRICHNRMAAANKTYSQNWPCGSDSSVIALPAICRCSKVNVSNDNKVPIQKKLHSAQGRRNRTADTSSHMDTASTVRLHGCRCYDSVNAQQENLIKQTLQCMVRHPATVRQMFSLCKPATQTHTAGTSLSTQDAVLELQDPIHHLHTQPPAVYVTYHLSSCCC